MSRRNLTPEQKERKLMIREFLKTNPIKDGNDLMALMREMMAEVVEGSLEGEMEIGIPRDRNNDFEPQIIKKNQNTISQDIEEKIISMYAKGMTTSDIESHIADIYGLEISDTAVSRITDKILPIAKEWQQRPLENIYTVVFMDAIHYHVRSEGAIVKKAVYVAIGINLHGIKDVLGMWIGENESAKLNILFMLFSPLYLFPYFSILSQIILHLQKRVNKSQKISA